jgi:hypothetical protein
MRALRRVGNEGALREHPTCELLAPTRGTRAFGDLAYPGVTMPHDNFDPDYVFSHHPATAKKLADYEAIHTGAKDFARVILAHVPKCDDRLAVLRLLREASMLACAAVSLEGRLK